MSTDIAELQKKVNKVGYDTGGGARCGMSLPPASTAKPEHLSTEDALALMRDGLRWRMALTEHARISVKAMLLGKEAADNESAALTAEIDAQLAAL